MREAILRGFLEGTVPAEELDADTRGTFEPRGRDSRDLVVKLMEGSFDLRSAHLVNLGDAVIEQQLDPARLEAIGFALIASDQFEWTTDAADGERLGNVLYDWSAPEINHDLTVKNVRRWRDYLVTGEPAFPSKSDEAVGRSLRITNGWRLRSLRPLRKNPAEGPSC